MSGAAYPVTISEAFAINADPVLYRNTIPATTTDTQRASLSLGFPPRTMTPIAAGGAPMLGPDMNGILYAMTTHTIYQQSGQPYRFNADVVAAIEGYASGTILGSTDGVTVWFSIAGANMTDPDSAGAANWVPMYSYGLSVLPATNGGIVTLTSAQVTKSIIVITGNLATNLQLIFPNYERRWLIINATTGSFATTVKIAGQTGVQIPQGGYSAPTEVYCNGTDIFNVVAPTVIPTDVAPTPNTIPVRSNVGYLYATYFNQSSPQENFTVTNVIAEAGDGFFRKIAPVNFSANLLISWLAGQVANGQVPLSAVTQWAAQLFTSPAFTGVPTTTTAALGTTGAQVASVSFANPAANISGPAGNFQLPNGLIVNYGVNAFAGGSSTENIVVPFSRNYSALCYFAGGITDGGNTFLQLAAKTVANATLVVTQRENGGGFGAGNIYWFSFGR